MTFPILASLLVRLVVLLPFQLLRLSLATPSRWTPLALSVFLHCVVVRQSGRLVAVPRRPGSASDRVGPARRAAVRPCPARRRPARDSTVAPVPAHAAHAPAPREE